MPGDGAAAAGGEAAGEAAAEQRAGDPPIPSPAAPAPSAETFVEAIAEVAGGGGTSDVPASHGERVKASPLARRIARERGVDLHALNGSGPGGRIVKADVERAADGATSAAAPGGASAAAPASAPAPRART